MSETPNFAMPLLFAAQAQKEITHNEAIALIDALLCGCAAAVADDPAGLDPEPGSVWIVGEGASGDWSDRAGQLAMFTAGGWRYALPVEGMQLFDRQAAVVRRCNGTGWDGPAAVPEPSGGAIVDSEARAALAAVLAVLRGFGMLAAT